MHVPSAAVTDDNRWWAYLQRLLDDNDLTPAGLAAKAGIDRTLFTGWKNGRTVSVPNARAIANALGLNILDVLVNAGILAENEAALTESDPDPSVLSDDALLAEIRRRFRRSGLPSAADAAADPGAYPEVKLPGSGGPRRLPKGS